MIVDFNIFDQFIRPQITLCNPNKTELYSLGLIYNTKLSYRFNALSELTFSLPQYIDDVKTEIPYYDFIKAKRLVHVDNIGYFIIGNIEETLDGKVPVKNVKCVSIDGELITKKLSVFSGSYYFYRPTDPTKSLLDILMDNYLYDWTIAHVDTDLMNKFRSFDVSDTTVYNFLVTDIEQTFNCIFKFDIVNKTISAYTSANSTTETDIYLSFDNLLKSGTFTEIADEIATALFCYGGNDLDIRAVNPLGTNVVYNFDYYKNTDWMTVSLIGAITEWEKLIEYFKPYYSSELIHLKTKNDELTNAKTGVGGLTELQNDYNALESVQQARIAQGLPIDDITAQMDAIQVQINAVNALIVVLEAEIALVTETLIGMNEAVSFERNFTSDQLKELNTFIFQSTFQNENIIQLDSMTPSEVQTQSQELYDQSIITLAKVSQPRYELSVDSANFPFLKEFQYYTNQLELGSVVTIQTKENFTAEIILLQIDINFDDPKDFKLTFSNRLRLDNGYFIYTDLLGQTVKTGSSVSFNAGKWTNWSEYKSEVTTFIDSSLNASLNNVVAGANQEILINGNGIKARKFNGLSGYEPEQSWLTNNSLVFTDDAWQTAKIALGKVSSPSPAYGIVGEQIVGKVIAGEFLQITNSGPGGIANLTLDQNGLSLVNADFTLTTTNELSQIILDPADGITVQTRPSIIDPYTKVFYVDILGNLTFSGVVTSSIPPSQLSGILTADKGGTGKDNGSNTLTIGSGAYVSGVNTGDGSRTGSMYAGNITKVVTIASSNVYYQVDGSLSAGYTPDFTFQNNRELKCLYSGYYLVNWSMTIVPSAPDQDGGGTVMVNGVSQAQTENHTKLKETSGGYSIGGTGIINLGVNDLVSLAVENDTSASNITVKYANLTLFKVS